MTELVTGRVTFAAQYGVPCITVAPLDTADSLIAACIEAEAMFDDGEDCCCVCQFPGGAQELYTESAIIRTFARKAPAAPERGDL